MVINGSRLAKGFVLLAVLGSLAACGLPRTGPSKQEIFSGSVQQQGDAFIVTVDDFVTRATSVVPALGFDQSFLNAGVVGSDTIQPGDTLSLQIWENVESGLLTSTGQGATVLEEVQVDGGRIDITARRVGQQLVLAVRDTGAGPGAAATGTDTSGGFGLVQVRERLATVYGGRASLTLQAAGDAEGGTLATLHLPLS